MKEYTIWFEFFGRRMKTTVKAGSEAEARVQIRERIVFHKVEKTENKTTLDDIFTSFKPFG
jgi:hypothetical protein